MSESSAPTPPPEKFNFAQHVFQLNRFRAEKVAYYDEEGSISFAELEERALRFASGLKAAGVKREERVLLAMQDCVDWPVSFLGCLYAGVIPVCVNTVLTADDYAYMLENSRAQLVITSAEILTAMHDALQRAVHEVRLTVVSGPAGALKTDEVSMVDFLGDQSLTPPVLDNPDLPAFWLYSSGSTGRPKGTVHTHANLYWTAELYGKAVLGLTESDVCFSAGKLYFAYGLGNGLTFPLTVGASTVLMAKRATPDAVFARLKGEEGAPKPTVFFGAPTGYAGMLSSTALPKRSETALRLASSAGEALPADLGERFRAHFGIDIVDGIGSTEMCHVYLSNRPERVRYGTTGWPVPGYEVELRSEDGGTVPDGEPGDLFVKGPTAALMYWGNREKTRETFQGAMTKTGDKYIRNSDGSFTYAGRSDDMLKVSGIYVSPFEVESTLVQHPAVLEAAVVGSPDETGLTKTKAFVVLKHGQRVSVEELKSFVKERLAPYKYPRAIEFLQELPKTATGKIQRFKLRQHPPSGS